MTGISERYLTSRHDISPSARCVSCESFRTSDCLKAYVCVLYDSPCAPLLLSWLGEVERGDITYWQCVPQAKRQGFTSPSPCVPTWVQLQGAYGAPTGAVGAADGRRRMLNITKMYLQTRVLCLFLRYLHSVFPVLLSLSADIAKASIGNAFEGKFW